MAQFIRGERGGNLLLYRGFMYKKKEHKGAKDYYICHHVGCNVRLHTLANTLNVVHYNGNQFHQHPRPIDDIVTSVMVEEMKNRIDADPTKHLPKMWEEVIDWHETTYGHGFIYPDFTNHKSKLYRHRAESMPALPTYVQDIDFAAVSQV